MATTAVLAELIVIGLETLVWIYLAVLAFAGSKSPSLEGQSLLC